MIIVSKYHKLGHEVACERIEKMLSDLMLEYNGKIRDVNQYWNPSKSVLSFSFITNGTKINGNINMGMPEFNNVTVKIELPWYATVFENKIAKTVKKELEQLLQ